MKKIHNKSKVYVIKMQKIIVLSRKTKLKLQLAWWIFLLILMVTIPHFAAIVAVIYFPYILLRKIIRYLEKR